MKHPTDQKTPPPRQTADLSRREALLTGAKYAGLTAATLMILTPKAQAESSQPAPAPQWDSSNWEID